MKIKLYTSKRRLKFEISVLSYYLMIGNNMKKILIILGILLGINLIFIGANKAFADSSENEFKKAFYDGFEEEMFNSLKSSLLSEGFTKNSVNTYILTMKKRFNRTQLENATWNCVKNCTVNELTNTEKVYEKCFNVWIDNYFFKTNSDVLYKLEK